MAFSPVATPVRAETDWSVVGGGAAVGAASGAAVGAIVGDGPGAVAGAVVGSVWGAIAGYFAQDKTNAALLDAKTAYGMQLKNATGNYLSIAKASAQNDINNYEMLSLYYARKAEWAALQLYNEQTANGQPHTYNPYYVLAKSEVANGTMAMMWKIAQTYETILNSNANLASTFVGTYEEMSWGYFGTGAISSRIESLNPMYIKVLYKVPIDTSYTKFATFSPGLPIYIVNGQNTDANVTSTVTITNRNGTVAYNQSLTIGWRDYRMINVPEAGEYNIHLSSSGLSAYALCSAGISGSYTLAPFKILLAEPDYDVRYFRNTISAGVHKDVSYCWFHTTADVNYQVDLTFINTDLTAIATKVATMNAQANSFAQAYYNSLIANGGGANRVMPDIVFPDPDVLEDMTPEQIQAIYLAYLRQMQDWFSSYSVQDPNSVKISEESLNLTVRGSIYAANGTLLYANTTIFTPYVSLEDMNLVIGNNTMAQPGFAIKWGTASSLEEFILGGHLQDIEYISLATGDYMIIEEMMLAGEPVTDTTLTVHTVEYITMGELDPLTPAQGATDMQWIIDHWYMIAIVLGAVLVFAWVATRNTAIGAIGLLLLLAGGAFWYLSDSSSVTGLLSGLFNLKGGP